MKLQVLGCDGGEGPYSVPSSFLIDGRTVVDMGSAASMLSLEEQCGLHHVLLTHAHLDHIKDLAFVAENVLGLIDHTIVVHAFESALATVRSHLLNGTVWPDFSRIPVERPIYEYSALTAGQEITIDGLAVLPIAMSHPDDSAGFLLDSGSACVALSGDTGPTDEFWKRLGERGQRLAAVVVEASFPDRLEELALKTGHLCPSLLERELHKLDLDVPIYVYGLKSATRDETRRDLADVADPRIRRLESGFVLEF